MITGSFYSPDSPMDFNLVESQMLVLSSIKLISDSLIAFSINLESIQNFTYWSIALFSFR